MKSIVTPRTILILAALVTWPTAVSAQVNFLAATSPGVGTSPRSVAMGDFNGDGKQDLVVANGGDNNVSILLGDGVGGFAPQTTWPVGNTARSVAVGDFNGDGKPDLAVANGFGYVAILLGNGSGMFAPAVNFSVGDGIDPECVVVGDFNRDGKQDLATANSISSNVSILLGNGAGAFSAPVHFDTGPFSSPSGTAPLSVAVGDFNGDGKQDLVTANIANSVSVLLGDGAGGFSTAVNFAVGGSPGSVAVGDFNADGKQDLATANNSNVSILLGNGLGSFAAAVSFPVNGAGFVTVGDFNGDSKEDLAVAAFAAVGDFNGDTKRDLAGSGIKVLLGNGSGGFSTAFDFTVGSPFPPFQFSILLGQKFAPAASPGVGTNPKAVAAGDFDGDGKKDLVVANLTSNNASILLGNGAGGFAAAANFGAGVSPFSVGVSDFNGDGKQDLAVVNNGANNVSILLGNGSGGFAAAVNYGVGSAPQTVAIGDLNGDGKQDLAVANLTTANVSILLGDGAGAFSAAVNFSVGSSPRSVALGDFNGDGKLDLAVANNNVSILLGDGAGGLGPPVNLAVASTPFWVAVADFNADGKQDIVVANRDTNIVSILRGDGAGGFAPPVTFGAGVMPIYVAAVDLNGDGRLDLAAVNVTANTVSILLGNGAGGFGGATSFGVGTTPQAVAVGDWNGDGKPDLAVPNFNSNNVSILLNTFSTPPGVAAIGAATAGSGQATIAFNAPIADGGSPVTGYAATCNPGGITGTGGPLARSITVTGLANGTPYTCSVMATNLVGTGLPSATVPITPSNPAVFGAPSATFTASTATLDGSITSDGGTAITERGFVYSTTAANGNPLIGGAGVTKATVAGTTGLFSATITGLSSGAGYSFKAYATNAAGPAYSSVATFTTLILPVVTTGVATGGTQGSATLNGMVNPSGSNTSALFSYGLTTSYGTQMAALPVPGAGSSPVAVSAPITGLACGTTYHFRVAATSTAGTALGSDAMFATGACGPLINSFTASSVLVSPGGASTLSWSVSGGASVTLNGATAASPSGSQIVNPPTTTTYTLVATAGGGSTSRSVTVTVNDGTAGVGTPTVTSPGNGQALVVTGVGFTWTSVGGATGYDMRVSDGTTGLVLFSGSLSGGASTSTLISLSTGSYRFAVRACAGGVAASQCGGFGTVSFSVSPAGPSEAPTVTFPTLGANLTSSTQTLSWTAVTPNPVLSGLTYEVLLRDLTAGTTALQITVPSPNLSTIFTMNSSAQYELKVRACQASCGPYSAPVTFAVTLPSVPATGPTGMACSVSGGNSLTCNWNAVTNADAYQIQVVQAPPAGPGGGALTATAKQVSATTVTLPVPAGAATVFLAACNGDGCGPYSTVPITAAGPNPSQANIGTPMAGTVVTGPGVLFTWNRVPGDSGSNTNYRLFVQDLSRQATALDVFTTNNFYSAYFKAEGARYDALVVSNPGQGSQQTGPSQGFNVAGASATAPTMVSPAHNSSVTSGNIQLGWSPVPGATLYQYFVAVLGQGTATVQGVTPGLLAQVPLTGTGAGTVYSGIVRACPAGATCVLGSDAGWGPWSNAPGGPGVTNFTVVP